MKHRSGAVGGIAFFEMTFHKAGEQNAGHAHSFAHPSWVVRGKAVMIANGKETELNEGDIVWVPAGIAHITIAKEDNTKIVCLQPLRDSNNPGDVIDECIVPVGTPMHLIPVDQRKKFIPLVMSDALAAGYTLDDLK